MRMTRKRRAAILVGLVCLSSCVQIATIRRATVPALDAVRFVEVARRMDREGLLPTIRDEKERPLCPACVWAAHEVIDYLGTDSRGSWALSAQLAAAVPLVLCVLPVYFVSVRLVGPRAGLAGAVFFCVLPRISRLGADGIADSVHLLFFAVAFWAMVEGGGKERTGKGDWAWLTIAGVATGLAMLARVEAILAPAALLVVLLALACRRQDRRAWTRVGAASACFAIGFGLIWGPYAGAVNPRPLSRPEQEPQLARLDASETAAMSFPVKETTISLRRRGAAAAAGLVGEKLASAFGYWIGVFALIGVWRRLKTKSFRQSDALAATLCTLYLAAVFCFVVREGYVEARHLAPLVVVGIGCAGHGALELGRLMARGLEGRRSDAAWSARFVVAAASLACLAVSMSPLHAGRVGHRRAGEWLALEAPAGGRVLDTRGWTGLYSGRATWRYDQARLAFGHPELAYVVLEQRELDYPSDRARTLRRLLDTSAERVALFPSNLQRDSPGRAVVVYHWRPRTNAGAGGKPPAPMDHDAHVASRQAAGLVAFGRNAYSAKD